MHCLVYLLPLIIEKREREGETWEKRNTVSAEAYSVLFCPVFFVSHITLIRNILGWHASIRINSKQKRRKRKRKRKTSPIAT